MFMAHGTHTVDAPKRQHPITGFDARIFTTAAIEY